MKSLIIVWAIAASACAYDPDDVQSVKSVKGGPSRYIYKGGENISRFYNSRQINLTKHNEVEEIGVCYIEIPTAQLVSDQNHVPAGNGSRPELSRIRSCCRGYTRNIHDFMVCDPVCSKSCINSLCVAPETCQCYPDYVKNAAGFCTATCPIGCQNGHCSGGECICNSGYKLDSESKYCIPSCRDNCGGIGNCTAPNTCSCQPGYQTTPDGSCKPVCDHCEDGECTAPNRCTCRSGYSRDAQEKCKPQCTPACQPNTNCIAPNVCSAPSTSEYSPQHQGLPLNVVPLHTDNLHTNASRYPNPYNPNYPQGPYYHYPGNNPNSHPNNPSDHSHDQEGQVARRPDDTFYPYPYQGAQYTPQGNNLPNNTLNLTQQTPGQLPNQYPRDPYPGVGLHSYPKANSSYPHRGDVDSDNDKYPNQVIPSQGQTTANNTINVNPYPGTNYNSNNQESNFYYAGGRQQNNTVSSMSQHGSNSYDSSNQRAYDHTQQGAYNKTQQEAYDSRNQRTFDSTQHGSFGTSNQRSYDSSRHYVHGFSDHDEFDSEYQINFGNFNRDTQNSSGHAYQDNILQSNSGSYNHSRSSNQGVYGSSQQGSLDSSRQQGSDSSRQQGSRHETQSSTNQGNHDLQQGSYQPNQGVYGSSQGSFDSSRQQGSDSSRHQGTFDSSRQDTQSSTNQGNHDSQQGSYRPNQGVYDSSQGSFDSSRQQGSDSSRHQGTFDSSRQDTQSSTNQGNHDSQQGSYRPNQGVYGSSQGSFDSSRQQGSDSSRHQGTFDSSRQDSQSSNNQGNHDSQQGSYRPNQGQYPYYNSMSLPRQTPEASNQVSNQTGADNTHHSNQQGFYNNFDIDQQTNDVPVCSMPCINGYCVEGNECRCKPGYIPDRVNPNICQPHCPGGCPNGLCSAPRLCLCNVGYYKDTSIKGRQVCVKRIR